jgi:murein DD-endopeptidase MepM/ murein hydrolase activator NlpD
MQIATIFRNSTNPNRRKICALISISILAIATPAPTSAQAKRPQHKAAPTVPPKPVKVDCGSSTRLLVNAGMATQGTLIFAELRTPATLTAVSAKWTDKDVSFWQVSTPATPKGENLWRAFIGIDLEQSAGDYKLTVSTKSTATAAESTTCAATITVREGKFPTEHLNVAPNFVEPNPEQLAKAQSDQKKLRELYATVTPEKLWTGKFRVPLDGVKTGGNFGRRRVLNGKSNSPHSGVDLSSPTGTPVHAAQSGRVVLAEELYFSGNTVLIDHGLGIYTLYGHFSEIDAKPGDLVKSGDVIGKVGATGRVTGPHLHWGLTIDRSRVNALSIVGKQ